MLGGGTMRYQSWRLGVILSRIIIVFGAALLGAFTGWQTYKRGTPLHAKNTVPGTHGETQLYAMAEGESGAPMLAATPNLDVELPRCYTSPEAVPTRGAWVAAAHGLEDAPATLGWPHPSAFDFLTKCQWAWNASKHKAGVVRPYWEWEATDCLLEKVDTEKFCKAVSNRKGILLVGDSLTRLMTVTLASIFRAENSQASLGGDRWRACNGSFPIRYIRNDYLDARTTPFKTARCEHPSGHPATNTVCNVFATDEILKRSDLLVINSGAHARDLTEYGEAMRSTSGFLMEAMHRLHGDDVLTVFRNTVPGHWGCEERRFDPPSNEAAAQSYVEAAPPKYQWSNFSAFNKKANRAFAHHGWTILDAYTPTLLRTDSHLGDGDCLHYCLPGPADHWVRLLYNILKAQTD